MTTKTGIIYLQRDKFEMYSPYLPSILEFRFVPEFIRDFDLVNRELLENLLKVFLGNNKVPPSGMVIVVADSASFMKDFVSPPAPVTNPTQPATPPPSLEDLHNQANQYLEHIPFESVGSKVFPLATGVRAYATNQEIYEGLKVILEKQGFIIEAVLPGFIFGPNLSNRPSIDGASVGVMLQKIGTLQGYNLLKETTSLTESTVPGETANEAEEKETSSDEGESSLEKPGNKRIMIAVAISAIVLIFLVTGIVIYMQFQERPKPPPPAVAPQASAPTITPQVTQPITIVDAKELTVQIVTPSSKASSSANLSAEFTKIGVKSVVPLVQESLSSSNLLVFSPKVSSQTRSSITTMVKTFVPDVIIQDKLDAAFDVTVILGK